MLHCLSNKVGIQNLSFSIFHFRKGHSKSGRKHKWKSIFSIDKNRNYLKVICTIVIAGAFINHLRRKRPMFSLILQMRPSLKHTHSL